MITDNFDFDDWSIDAVHDSELRHRRVPNFGCDDYSEYEEEESSDEDLFSSSIAEGIEQASLPRLLMESNMLRSKEMINMNHEYFVRTVQRMNIVLVFLGLCATVAIIVISYSSKLMKTNTSPQRLQVPSISHRMEEDFDIHLEHPWSDREGGKIAEIQHANHDHQHEAGEGQTVAIGLAVTARALEDLTLDNVAYRLPFLKSLMPSFCKTCSGGYQYHFYTAFDQDDPYLSEEKYLRAVHARFTELIKDICPRSSNYSLHFVQCSHSKNPTWAQNDAMMEAYLDNMEYFYRVNDDTQMLSPGWTETFISTLGDFTPPNVGVVGPLHKGGNEAIMTYDFVHKTHIDVFGYYYPRIFTDWWADDWMSEVYGAERTIKLPSVRLMHTQESGQRYKVQWNNHHLIQYQINDDKATLARYLKSKNEKKEKIAWDSTKRVISMSLWGNQPRYTFGALRNAQILPVFFPGWTLRIYVEKANELGKTLNPQVSKRMLVKLQSLGTQLAFVDTDIGQIPPMMWRFLAADDNALDYFIVRDSDARLSDRDFVIVEDWIRSNTAFHCVRDHPSHSGYSILGGMWGGKPNKLESIIPIQWQDLMLGYTGEYVKDMQFLANAIWPKVKDIAYCHDSVSCQQWPNSHPFPIGRKGAEHIGQVFDAFGNAREDDVKVILQSPINGRCDPSKDSMESIKNDVIGHGMDTLHGDSHVQDLRKEAEEEEGDSSLPPVLWSMEFHTGPIRDLKYLLSPLGVKFIDKSLSSRCNMTRSCASNLKVINKQNGLTPSAKVKLQFYEEYISDPEMGLVTHYFCSYPAAMCELYQPFGKPMIVYVTTRYEHGRFSRDKWNKWNKALVALSKNPNNLIAANNIYDASYVEFFAGIKPLVIPSVCSYVNTTYSPSRKNILLAEMSSPHFEEWFLQDANRGLQKHKLGLTIKPLRSIYPSYAYSDLAAHEAIIYVPYQVSMMSFCESYQMNIPMFFPTIELLVSWHLKDKVIGKLTWNAMRSIIGEDTIGVASEFTNGTLNPNMENDQKTLEHWIKFADFYQKPNIIYFSSVDDLVEKLDIVDLNEISKRMKTYNEKTNNEVISNWKKYFKTRLR